MKIKGKLDWQNKCIVNFNYDNRMGKEIKRGIFHEKEARGLLLEASLVNHIELIKEFYEYRPDFCNWTDTTDDGFTRRGLKTEDRFRKYVKDSLIKNISQYYGLPYILYKDVYDLAYVFFPDYSKIDGEKNIDKYLFEVYKNEMITDYSVDIISLSNLGVDN